MTSAVDIVNEALELTGQQVQITALDDGSPAAIAASTLYAPTVELVLREIDPDFARTRAALALAAGVTVPDPWSFAYTYPPNCVRLRQVMPAIGGYDPNDPAPVRSEVSLDPAAGKLVLSNQTNAVAVFTTSQASEDEWDSAFREAVVRRLGSPLAMALAGRPDFARELLDEAERYAQLAETVDE